MAKQPKTYLCKNKSCTLGTVHNPGRFTGGISADLAVAISGDPDAKHGEGVCPNCGQPGTREEA
jgi:hypothetical protein